VKKEFLGISNLISLNHIGIAVYSLEEAIARYSRMFDCEVLHSEINDEQQTAEAMIKCGGVQIQFLAPTSETSPIAKFLDKRSQGVQQIAFDVEDLDLACDQARGLGIRVLYPQSKYGTAGSKINFLHPQDCNGVLIELVELQKPNS
jgi:methylmalonyl-CoA/ethylmalonyl-CoA epimerase